MTHSPPSHLEWAHSAGNRPETLAPRRARNLATPAKQSPPLQRETKARNHVSIIQSRHDRSMLFTPLAVLTPSTSTAASATVSRCAAQWCVITLWMARSPSLDSLSVSCAATNRQHDAGRTTGPSTQPGEYFSWGMNTVECHNFSYSEATEPGKN